MQIVLHILQRRFGEVSPELEQAIRTVAVDDLTLLLDVALDATSPSEVEAVIHKLQDPNGQAA